ncbi:PAS domain-containing protein [Streptomyces sp. NPDC052109]|uniref:PAS domain-containing protein n=1 Tax=Streptomyces sp. NPDC052109 TaxID=3155527 RepID=UPI00343629B7
MTSLDDGQGAARGRRGRTSSKGDAVGFLGLDGVIRSLNAAMATQLGRPWKQCVGRGFVDLLSEGPAHLG